MVRRQSPGAAPDGEAGGDGCRAILDSSARGDTVLDAFLGSGATVIAAERTGRRCCALELDPGYVDTAIRRWQTLTGDKARHAGTGRYFDDLAREAEAANAAG